MNDRHKTNEKLKKKKSNLENTVTRKEVQKEEI